MGWRAFGTLLVWVAACGGDARHPQTQPQPQTQAQAQTQPQTQTQAQTQTQPQGLHARFEREELEVESTVEGSLVMIVENRGAVAETISLDNLGSAIFAIEVTDGRGQRVYTIPPGMPPANYAPRTEVLAPGASRRFEMTLHVFSPPLPDGTYSVRAQGMSSDTLRLVVDD